MKVTLLAANTFGGLVGNNRGQVAFFDIPSLIMVRDWQMPIATHLNGLGVILEQEGREVFLDYKAYSHPDFSLQVKAVFNPSIQQWYTPELPELPNFAILNLNSGTVPHY